MIGDILKGKHTLTILKVLFDASDRELYQAEIATLARLNAQTVNRILKELSGHRMVLENRNRGKLVFYRIDKEHPLVESLAPLFSRWGEIESYCKKGG